MLATMIHRPDAAMAHAPIPVVLILWHANMNAGCDNGTCYLPALFFADMDGDGYGDPNVPLAGCTQPPMSSLDNTDCDDTRNDVYPGAPGTAEDIDNNCSGALEAGEFSGCPGDFDNSGNINTVDLLIFLSDYGCSSACIADLTGDGIVGTSDLLFFLGVFGTNCP
jgi:Putative metal-binding motif